MDLGNGDGEAPQEIGSAEAQSDPVEDASSLPLLPPNRPGWRELLSTFAIVWPVEIVLAIVILVASTRTMSETGAEGDWSLNPWAVVLTAPISAAAVVIACWLFACRRFGRTFSDGLFIVPVSRQVLKQSAALGLGAAALGIVIGLFYGTDDSLLAELVIRPTPDHPDKISFFYPMLVLIVFIPVIEELYYRGFLFTVFEHMIGPRVAMGIVVVWFGLLHAPQIGGNMVALATVMAAGGLFTWIRLKYHSIVPSIACHVTYNSTLVIAGIIDVSIHNATVA